MGRKIILLSDGTGNSAAKVWRTNVWRVFESLDLSGSDQVAFYDDGVGTSSFKPLAVLGGAFGFGLKRNVLDTYKFVCRNYRDDGKISNDPDEIYGFGFSRGAFTIRVVAGLIINQGLVRADSESQLDHLAIQAYRAYRRNKFHTYLRLEAVARAIRDLVTPSDYDPSKNRQEVRIKFLGLWDTVAAYGLPIDEMTRGVSNWLWPLELPDNTLDDRVDRACHALSIDDERTTFHPVPWDESAQKPAASGNISDLRIRQVWFAGVHSNVGGGYPDDSLAHIPFVWMMDQTKDFKLKFKKSPDASPQTEEHAQTMRDKDGRLYDPRSGLGGYYRYGPRDILQIMEGMLWTGNAGGKRETPLPKIHESVIRRIKNDAHSYGPVGLPANYEIVTDAGQIIPPAANPYEAPAQARARLHCQEAAWNVVWWRRIVYFVTVAVSVYFVAFPLWKALPASDEYEHPLRWLSDIIRLAGSFLPSAAAPWLNGYARAPLHFAVVAVALVAVLLVGSRLASSISDRMGRSWRSSLTGSLADPGEPRDAIYNLRTSPAYVNAHWFAKQHLLPAFFAISFVYLGITFASHAIFNVLDDAGVICKETSGATGMAKGEVRTATLRADKICDSTRILVEEGATYLVVVKPDPAEPFYRGDIRQELDPKSPIRLFGGFSSIDVPGLGAKITMALSLPLRRELIRPWFRIVARIGGTGGEELFLDPDPKDNSIDENVKATRDGELFMFVNDAVIGYGWFDYFYKQNRGTATVTVTRK